MLSTQANQALPLFPLLIFSHFVAKGILIPLRPATAATPAPVKPNLLANGEKSCMMM